MAMRTVEKRLISEAIKGKVKAETVKEFLQAEKVCEALNDCA